MVRGEFKSFTHRHTFREEGGGTLMVDDFIFKSPLGPARLAGRQPVPRTLPAHFAPRADCEWIADLLRHGLLSHLLGIRLMPRIRNWKDLRFFRPSKDTRYRHIDTLFSDTVDWQLIEIHWQDLLQVALSIKAGTISSAQLLRRLGSYSRRNRLYQAFRELGRLVRTVFLLEYLSNAQLREHITAIANKVEAYNGFAKWLNFGGEGVIDTLDPVEQEKHLKYNHLVANAAAIQNVIDLTRALRALHADGYIIPRDDLAQLSPYQTRRLKRFGDYTLSLNPPEPFDAELLMPFQLDEQPETVVVARRLTAIPIFGRMSA
jgi:hypothetical protein